MSDVFNAIAYAKEHFEESDVLYFNRVLCIANSLATSDEDRRRIAREYEAFAMDRNERGANHTAFYKLASIAVELCEGLSVETPAPSASDTRPPSPAADY